MTKNKNMKNQKSKYRVYLPMNPSLTSVCVPGMKEWGEDLEEYSQTCEKSHSWNGKDTLARTWLLRLKRTKWLRLLSSRMLKSSLTESSVDAWTSYLRASLASPSARQAFGRELKTQDICSHSSQTEFSFADQTGSHLKTSKESSVVSTLASRTQAYSNMSWVEWKKLVTKVRSQWSARVKSQRLTKGSVSSCSSETQNLTLALNDQWGTPKEQDSRACLTDRGKSNLGEQVHGLHVQGKLSTSGKNQGSSWPTPRTGKTDGTPESESNRESPSLSAVALGDKKTWPTPTTGEEKATRPLGNQNQKMLSHVAITEEAIQQSKGVSDKAWATPNTMDVLPPKTGEALARNKKKGGCKNLREDVVKPEMNPEIMFPTPTVAGLVEGGVAKDVVMTETGFTATRENGTKYGAKLRDAVEHMENPEKWATPQASDHVEGARTSVESNQKCLGRDLARNLGRLNIHGKLNPAWVEQLQGLPKNTTLLPKSWLFESQD